MTTIGDEPFDAMEAAISASLVTARAAGRSICCALCGKPLDSLADVAFGVMHPDLMAHGLALLVCTCPGIPNSSREAEEIVRHAVKRLNQALTGGSEMLFLTVIEPQATVSALRPGARVRSSKNAMGGLMDFSRVRAK